MRLVIVLFATALLVASACTKDPLRVRCTGDVETECHENYTCDPILGVCLRSCNPASETCPGSQYCDVPAGESTGVCRDGLPSGGDPGAGDPGAGDPGAGD